MIFLFHRSIAGFCTLLLLALGCLCAASHAQSWQITTWQVDDGLPDVTVTALAQTPEGYLWVGTPAGLARFDGVKFRVFRADAASGLSDSRITTLLTARDGTLWVGTQGGALFHLSGKRFEPVPLGGDSGSQLTPMLRRRLLEDSEGGIWWQVSTKVLARYFQGQWKVFSDKDGLPSDLWDLARDENGTLWAEGGGRLVSFDGTRWMARMQLPPRWDSSPFSQTTRDGVWVASFGGSASLRGLICRAGQKALKTPPTKTSQTGNEGITAMLEDRSGHWWAGWSSGGVSRLDEHGQWRAFENQGALNLPSITCLLEDQQGNLWAGGSEFGLHRIAAKPLSRQPIVEAPDVTLTSCSTRDGTLWVGTRYSGILRRSKETFEPVAGDWGAEAPNVTSLFADSRDMVWAGTTNGLFRYEGGRFQRVKTPFPDSILVSAILENKAGDLWFGGDAGLLLWHPGEFHAYPLAVDIRSLAEDSNGTLWVGTINSGLYRLSQGSPRRLEKVASYPARHARALYCDVHDTLWIGSWADGLFRYREGRFENLTPGGQPPERIQEILADEHDTLWTTSTTGIFSIPLSVLDAYIPGKSPPLLWRRFSLDLPFNQRTCSGSGSPMSHRTPDERLWIPNMDHMAIIEPARIQRRLDPANVRIESVSIDGKSLPVSPGEVLRVSSTVRQFDFQYTALDLTAPSGVVFLTYLEGMDPGWTDAGSSRSARYSKLPPGDYQFRLMASGSDARWSEGTPLRLIVIPQWWERPWVQAFGLIMALLITAGGVLTYQKWRTREKLRQIQTEQRLEAERARIARDIHDEMGATLTQITTLSTLARNSSQPAGHTPELDQIQAASRELTRAMDEIVWAVDPRHDTLDSLVNYLARTAQNYLRAGGLRCRLDIPLTLPEIPLTSRIRHDLFLVLKEALNNVVKHASATEACFGVKLDDGEVAIYVEDNGKGLSAPPDVATDKTAALEDRISSGNGLKNMALRAQEIGGRLKIASQPGQGTRLTLWIPTAPSNS